MINITESQKIIDKEIQAIVNTIYENRDNDNFYHKGTFNTKDLPDHENYTVDLNKDAYFRGIIYSLLENINANHCIYWFELESDVKASELNTLLCNYRDTKAKKVPATNKNFNSRILYLGKRYGGYRITDGLTNIVGRMNIHLGYYKQPGTQGLQLYEYARGKDFNITIKVVEIEGLETYCLGVIEKLLAKRMLPLCGRYKL